MKIKGCNSVRFRECFFHPRSRKFNPVVATQRFFVIFTSKIGGNDAINIFQMG